MESSYVAIDYCRYTD